MILLAGAGAGCWFEIRFARLPGDRASRSLCRAIESIAVTLADGDELISDARLRMLVGPLC